MNRILKNSLLGTAVLMFFFLTAVHTCMAGEGGEVPSLPMTVQGVALIDGNPAPAGTIIEAYLDGEKVEEYTLDTSGDFYLLIPGDAGDEGKPVTFTVAEEDSGASYAWESGKQVLSIELPADDEADSESSEKSSISSSSVSEKKDESDSGENSGEIIVSSVSLPNVEVEIAPKEKIDADAGEATGAEQSTEYSEESSEESAETSSAPGFQIIYAVAGIILLAFGSKFRRETKRKP